MPAARPAPPDSRREGPGSRPEPTPEGFMSTSAKISLADMALALRDEQLEAKVVHYKAELETSPELDAITAQVVAEIQSLQAAARTSNPPTIPPQSNVDRAQIEIELIQSLKEMLGRTFRKGKLATTMQRKLGEVSKGFARIFFESELHEKIRGSAGEIKSMRFPEQALYHTFTRNQDYVLRQLDGLTYVEASVAQRANELFAQMIKDLRNDFLARTTPELNQLVKFLNEVLTTFFIAELPAQLGELAWEVVKEARLGDAKIVGGYKISQSAFKQFRQAFERSFMRRLVPFAEDEILRRVRESEQPFRAETIRFVADPHIFTEVCEVICEAVYDMLYNDGFLDLPTDWRARLSATQ
jgi:hypothetical protein